MKWTKFICALWCAFYAVSSNAQEVLDTICIVGNPSHLAIPHNEGSHYTWNVKGGNVLSLADSSDIRVLWGPSPGYFEVSVTETNEYGCSSETKAVVFLSLPDQASIKGPNEVCRGTTVILEGAAGSEFEWRGGRKRKNLSFIAERDTLIYLIALNGPCRNDTFYHQVKVYEPPVASMNPLTDTMEINTELDLFYTGLSAEGVDWYVNDEFIGNGYYQNYSLTDSGKYNVSQVVRSGICSDTLREIVYVTDEFAIYVPNAFTPNGDNVNDIFIFKGRGIKSFSARIYNRWGGLVYTWEEDLENGWDGTYNEEHAKEDTYVYKINVMDRRGNLHQYTGSVNLIR